MADRPRFIDPSKAMVIPCGPKTEPIRGHPETYPMGLSDGNRGQSPAGCYWRDS